MPYLNWKTAPIKPVRSDQQGSVTRLELTLEASHLTELAQDLQEALSPGGAELKLDLPEKWTIYFKCRAGLSRLQLAHPQTGEWVATVHLSEAHGERLLKELADPAAGSERRLVISELGALGPINNFDLIFSRPPA